MNFRAALMGVIIAILILSGCSRGSSDPDRYPLFRTGTQGLDFQFSPRTPDKFFTSSLEPFQPMILEVRNRGAFPQDDERGEFIGYLWPGGYDDSILTIEPRYITLRASDLSGDLEGKSPINGEGGIQFFDFDVGIFGLPQGVYNIRMPIIFTGVYRYRTISSEDVCIDPNPYSDDRDKVCDISRYGSIKGGGSQGAPVAVTYIEEDVVSDGVLFRITVRNVGGGKVIPWEDISPALNPHTFEYGYDEENRVGITSVFVGNLPVDACTPRIGERVRLINGEGRIICKMSTLRMGTGAFTSPLNIVLDYGYMSSIRKDIEIFEQLQFR
ncbi:TPA: hypothetical protein HA361_01275 [Candidatus Woesearchaeota archaeon]|nr:hypothetical protein [Candidatus Woesearchaeota archaeon]HII69275.1 hypothetical protein [Candidatus Woesearchaeota archaeon]